MAFADPGGRQARRDAGQNPTAPGRGPHRLRPDRQALEYLLNRIMGKPTERAEQDVNLRGGVVIELPDRAIEP